MVYNLVIHSKHEHIYTTFDCDPYLRQRFTDAGVQVLEFGPENMSEAVTFLSEHVDIVHAQNSGGPEPGVRIGLEAGKPVVETCQSPSLPSGHGFNSVTVVAVSNGIGYWWPDECRPDVVIYSCAQITRSLSKTICKERLGFIPQNPVVGRVGRLEGIKRPLDFVLAAEVIAEERPDVQFLLVGDGSDEKYLYRKMREMTSRGIDIKLPGFLVGEEKEIAFGAIDIFLYPTSMEGFGVSFAEAMALGIPIITYSDPVNVDVVGPAGLFVSDNLYAGGVRKPHHALARTTIDLLENPRECAKLSKWGKLIYYQRYRPKLMAAQYDRLYEKLYKETGQ